MCECVEKDVVEVENANENVKKRRAPTALCAHCTWGAQLRASVKATNCDMLPGCNEITPVLRCIMLQQGGVSVPLYMQPSRSKKGPGMTDKRASTNSLGYPTGLLQGMQWGVPQGCCFPCRSRPHGVCGSIIWMCGKAGVTDKLFFIEDESLRHEHSAAPCRMHGRLDCEACVRVGAIPLHASAGNLSSGPYGLFRVLQAQELIQELWKGNSHSPDMIKQAVLEFDKVRLEEAILYGNLVYTGSSIVDFDNILTAIKKASGDRHLYQVPADMKDASREAKDSYLLQLICEEMEYTNPFAKDRGVQGPIVTLNTFPDLYILMFCWRRALLYNELMRQSREASFGVFIDATGCIISGKWRNKDMMVVQFTVPHPSAAAAAETATFRPHGAMCLAQAVITDRTKEGFVRILQDIVGKSTLVIGKNNPVPRPWFLVCDFDLAIMCAYCEVFNDGMSFKELCVYIINKLDFFHEKNKDKGICYGGTKAGREEFLALVNKSWIFPCTAHFLRCIKTLTKYGAGFRGCKNRSFYEYILMLIYVRLLQSPLFCGIENWPYYKKICKLLKELFSVGPYCDLTLPLREPVEIVKDFAYFRPPQESDAREGKAPLIAVFEVKDKDVDIVWLHCNVRKGTVVEAEDSCVGQEDGISWEATATPEENSVIQQTKGFDEQMLDEEQGEGCVASSTETSTPPNEKQGVVTRVPIPTYYARTVGKVRKLPILTDFEYREHHLFLLTALGRVLFPSTSYSFDKYIGMLSRCGTNAYVELTIRRLKYTQMNMSLRQRLPVFIRSACAQAESEVREFNLNWQTVCSKPMTAFTVGGLRRGATKALEKENSNRVELEKALAQAVEKENRSQAKESEYRSTAAQLTIEQSTENIVGADLDMRGSNEYESSVTDATAGKALIEVFEDGEKRVTSDWGPKRQKTDVASAVAGLSPTMDYSVRSMGLPLLPMEEKDSNSTRATKVPCPSCSSSLLPGSQGIKYMSMQCSNKVCLGCCAKIGSSNCKVKTHRTRSTEVPSLAVNTPVVEAASNVVRICNFQFWKYTYIQSFCHNHISNIKETD